MKYTEISLDRKIEHGKCIATIGNFDALHFGHRVLISEALKLGTKHSLPVSLITFDPDPYSVIEERETKVLTPLETKKILLQDFGIDELVAVEFSKRMMELEPVDFIKKILEPLNIEYLVCGYDFSFGKNAAGNVELLASFINVCPIEEVIYMDERISSTSVKNCLSEGDLEMANRLLKREFSISGKVIRGNQIGRTIDFPTANIDYPKNQFLPKEGVYAGKVTVGQNTYFSMINIGRNPTFFDDYHVSVECHLLDFDSDIYDQTVKVEFHHFLRDEIKFISKDALVNQLNIDKQEVENYFSVL